MFLTRLTRRSATVAAAETPARLSRTGAVATENLTTTTLVAVTTAAAPATTTSAELGADVTRVATKGTTWRDSVKPSAEAAEMAAGKPPTPCATPLPAHPVAIYATAAAGEVAVVFDTAAPVLAAVSTSWAADEYVSTTSIDAATAALGSTPAANARAHRGIPPSPSLTDVAWTISSSESEDNTAFVVCRNTNLARLPVWKNSGPPSLYASGRRAPRPRPARPGIVGRRHEAPAARG